jgi:hypothetical protein
MESRAEEIAGWEQDWEKAAARAKLPRVAWNTMGARAPLYEQLRGAIDATVEMRRRVTGRCARLRAVAGIAEAQLCSLTARNGANLSIPR